MSSAAAHAFPSEPMTTCWPLKTEQTSLKIDKFCCLACTEPVGVFQSGTDGVTGISCGTHLIKQAADYNPNVQRATLAFVSCVWCFITTKTCEAVTVAVGWWWWWEGGTSYRSAPFVPLGVCPLLRVRRHDLSSRWRSDGSGCDPHRPAVGAARLNP